MNLPRINTTDTGKRIKYLMDYNGYTVKELQGILCLNTSQAIYKWLNGVNMPTIDNLIVLAYLFNTTIDDLIELEV